MATLYITTNADSGEGSLRSLIASAEAGDVIQPDPTAFPHGTVCEITVASTLQFYTGVTVTGAQTRIVLNGVSITNANIQLRAPCTFIDVDIIKYTKTGSGGTFWLYAAAETCTFIRCLVAGCKAQSGGAFYVASGANVECYSCVFIGNYGVGNGGVVNFAAATPSDSLFSRCTYVGNVDGSSHPFSNRSSVPTEYCKSDTSGLVSPPPSYTTSDWTKTLYESWDVHPSPNVAAETRSPLLDTNGKPVYDFDGLPRKASGYDGAYEQVYAQLFWIGLDANGDALEDDPYFELATGWASSPTATSCGSTAPSSVSTVYVSGDLSFADQPSRAANNRMRIIVAPNSSISILNSSANDYLDLEISRRSTFLTTTTSKNIVGGVLIMLDESKLLASYDATDSGTTYVTVFGTDCEINTFRTLYYNSIADDVKYDTIRFFRSQTVPQTLPGGNFSANTIRFDAMSSGSSYTMNFAPNTTFHAQSFLIADSDANGGTWFTNPVVLYPTSSVVSSGASNTVVDSSASYIVDLSEATGAVDLTLSGQVVRNNTNGVNLTGRAKVVSETIDFSGWAIAANGELTLRNCETQVASLTVNGWNLRVDSGLFSVSTLYANRNYNGASNGSTITPSNYIEIKNISSVNLSTLALNNCKLTFDATQPSFSSVSFANAVIEFKNLNSISVPSFNGDLGLKFNGVTSASFSSFNGVFLDVDDSTVVATSARVTGALACDGSTVNVETINAASITTDESTVAATTLKATTVSFDDTTFNNSSGTITYTTSIVVTGTSAITVKNLRSAERASGVAATGTFSGTSLVADNFLIRADDSITFTGSLDVSTLTINGSLTLLNAGSTDIGTLTLADNATLTTTTTSGKFAFVVGTLNLNENASLVVSQATLGTVNLSANLTLTVDSALVVGTLDANAQNVVFTATAASETFTSIVDSPKLVATCTSAFQSGTTALAASSSINAASVLLGALTASGAVSITSTTNGIGLSSISGSSVTLRATSQAVSLSGDCGTSQSFVLLDCICGALTASDLYLADDSEITCASLSCDSLTGAGDLSVVATGNVVSSGAFDFNGATSLSAANITTGGLFVSGAATTYDVDATDAITINGDLALDGVGTIDSETLKTTRLTVSGAATITTDEADLGVAVVSSDASVTLTSSEIIGTSITATDATLSITSGEIDVDELTLESGSNCAITSTNKAPKFDDVAIDQSSTLSVTPGSIAIVNLDSSGTLKLYGGENVAARITGEYSIASVTNESSDTLYVYLPSYPSQEITSVGSVVYQVYNGTAFDFRASADGADSVVFSWKDYNGAPVTIEADTGSGSYVVIERNVTAVYDDGVYIGEKSVAYPNVNGTSFRLFDGEKYLYDVAYTVTNPAFYKYIVNALFAPNGSTAALTRYDNFLALASIRDSISGDYLEREDVTSVKATLYKIKQKNIGNYEREPIANWTNVDVDTRCVLESVETSSMWTGDSVGFNFCWVPDQTLFDFVDDNGKYELQFRINVGGEIIETVSGSSSEEETTTTEIIGELAIVTFAFSVE